MIPQEGQRVRIITGHPKDGVVVQIDWKDETALVAVDQKTREWWSWDDLAAIRLGRN
jgi:hypothetical protein